MKKFKAEILISGMTLEFVHEAKNAHDLYMKLIEELTKEGKQKMLERSSSIKIEQV